MFPVDQIPTIEANPEDYRLLTRIPWTRDDLRFPVVLHPSEGRRLQSMVILDTETTGFEIGRDRVIELGMVKIQVDVESGRVVTIVAATSLYEDPGFAIPEIITEITGITDEMVMGQRFDDSAILNWFADDPIVVAHHAGFDRPMFEARFSHMDRLRWACSINDVPWKEYGFESSKLEYLLLKLGYFYQGHRASIDALATAFLLHAVPRALPALLAAESSIRVHIDAVGSTFAVKDTLKANGFRWDGDRKLWHTEVAEHDAPETLAFLSMTYHRGGDRAHTRRLTSRERYKSKD